MTQDQVSLEAGVSVNFYGKLERGRVAPSFGTLERLSQALHTDVSALFLPVDEASHREELAALLMVAQDDTLCADLLEIANVITRRSLRPAETAAASQTASGQSSAPS